MQVHGVRILWDISIFVWPTCPVPIRGSVGGQFYLSFEIRAECIWTIEIFQKVTQSMRYLRGCEFPRFSLMYRWCMYVGRFLFSPRRTRNTKVNLSFLSFRQHIYRSAGFYNPTRMWHVTYIGSALESPVSMWWSIKTKKRRRNLTRIERFHSCVRNWYFARNDLRQRKKTLKSTFSFSKDKVV